jgi:lipopolysaccharide transport system permease protein
VPINYVLSHSIKTFIQFILLIILIIYYVVTGLPIRASWLLVFFPFIFIWLAAISVGAGIIVSSLTTKYRDLRNIVNLALSLGMYATPVVYPISEIPARFRWISYINPISAPIELFRKWFFGVSAIDTQIIFISLGFTAILVFIGLVLFNQNEQNFIDVI